MGVMIPYLPRLARSAPVAHVMIGAALVSLVCFLSGIISDSPFLRIGDFTALVLVIYMLLTSVGIKLEFRFWRWWATRRVSIIDRRHQFTTVDHIDDVHMWFRFTPEAEKWVRENCRGRVMVVPQIDPHWKRVVVFSNPDDAFHFKMRWL